MIKGAAVLTADCENMSATFHAVYGVVPFGLVEVAAGSVQCSPRQPGATDLGEFAPESCSGVVMHAPASTLERRHELALALRALRAGAKLTALAANTKGGNRLVSELTAFGCEAGARPKRHHQIVQAVRPERSAQLDEAIANAIEDGGPRFLPDLGLWSQPGVFSWDRIDPGSQLLLDHLPPLEGRGADLGCGIGVLARHVLAGGPCVHLSLIDIDRRAVSLALKNNPGDKVAPIWADVRSPKGLPSQLDFVVTNPPFHDGGEEDKALGPAFIERAAAMLKAGGVLWLTANRQLPYEATLQRQFAVVEQIDQALGYKIYRATKGDVATKMSRTRAKGTRR